MVSQISVIIATYNQAKKLDQCLERLANQTLAHNRFEVIVVDDGGTDHTKQICQKWHKKLPKLNYYHQANQGAGAARNFAISKATSQLTVFINDDIYVIPEFLKQHVHFHQNNPATNQAALGFIDWHPQQKITPFMRWLTNELLFLGKFGGPQFAFNQIAKHGPDFHNFYTSNISLKTELLKKEPFDSDFKGYGWEDIELGYRLQTKDQLQIQYLPQAIGYHDHEISLQDFEKRMQNTGKNAAIFNHKHPELKIVPTGIKKISLTLIGNRATISILNFCQKILKILRPVYFYALSKRYFLQGLQHTS